MAAPPDREGAILGTALALQRHRAEVVLGGGVAELREGLEPGPGDLVVLDIELLRRLRKVAWTRSPLEPPEKHERASKRPAGHD